MMAKSSDDSDVSLTCAVCLEEFEEEGDLVPKLLPCSHTVCEGCINNLLHRNKVQCPECRRKHRVKDKVQTFPQNRYLLYLLNKNRTAAAMKNKLQVSKCKDHDKELNMFCRETGCEKPICLTCLVEEHKKHDFCEIDEEKRKTMRKINLLRQNLEAKLEIITATREDVTKKGVTCINELENRKDAIVQELDKQIRQVTNQVRDTDAKMEDELTAINERIELLNGLTQNLEDTEPRSEYPDITETLEKINEDDERYLFGTKMYKYPQCVVTDEARQIQLAAITQQEMSIVLPQLVGQDTRADPICDGDGPPAKKRKISNASDLNCTVLWTTDTEFGPTGRFALLGDDTVVVDCAKGRQSKIMQYDLQTGDEISSVVLENVAWAMTGVQLGGRSTVAMSLFRNQEIEIRDATDLTQVVLTHSVAPHSPGQVFTVSPSMLLYEDTLTSPREIHWLDCSAAKPKSSASRSSICLEGMRSISDVGVMHPDLLVATVMENGVHAFNTNTGQLIWSVRGKLPSMSKRLFARGVATDGRGHLYVCDYAKLSSGNGCIQMFGAEDGQYLGPLILKGENGFGNPLKLCWCESSSSLVVVHFIQGWNISKIKIQHE